MNETIAAIATPNAVGGCRSSVFPVRRQSRSAIKIFRPVFRAYRCANTKAIQPLMERLDAAGEIDNTIAVVYRCAEKLYW